ncbi:TPA: hypothetical protein EYO12_00620 [Candidatus Saccharibacteria bacterium]|nr:hypothetical protein [Candidatus Saccharibacteria bacterium]HIO87598.1 hypothetical protein [Candidatus Saccharibacteria bacterium]
MKFKLKFLGRIILYIAIISGVSTFLLAKVLQSLSVISSFFPAINFNSLPYCIATVLVVISSAAVLFYFTKSDSSYNTARKRAKKNDWSTTANTNIFSIYEVGDKEASNFLEKYRNSFMHYRALKALLDELTNTDSPQSKSTILIDGKHRTGKTTLLAIVNNLLWAKDEEKNKFEKLIYTVEGLEKLTEKPKLLYICPVILNDFDDYIRLLLQEFKEMKDVTGVDEHDDIEDYLNSFIKHKYGIELFKKNLHSNPVAFNAAQKTSTSSPKKLYVVFDDIDRLEAKDILKIFKMKMYFERYADIGVVLLLDLDLTIKVLQTEYRYIDNAYLEKYLNPDTTHTIELKKYEEDYLTYLDQQARQLDVSTRALEMLCVEKAISFRLKKFNVQDLRYDEKGHSFKEIKEHIIGDNELLEDALITAYLNMPLFQMDRTDLSLSNNDLYAPTEFSTEKPFRSLFNETDSQMEESVAYFYPEEESKFSSSFITEQFNYDGLHCNTVHLGHLPNWHVTKLVIKKVEDEKELLPEYSDAMEL